MAKAKKKIIITTTTEKTTETTAKAPVTPPVQNVPSGSTGEQSSSGAVQNGQEKKPDKTKPKPQPQEGRSISPSISDADLRTPNPRNLIPNPQSEEESKEKMRDKAKDQAKNEAKKVGKELGKRAAQAIARAAASAAQAVVAFFGPWCLIIAAALLILAIIFALIMYAIAAKCEFGKCQPVEAGTAAQNKDVKTLDDYSTKPTGTIGDNASMQSVVAGFNQMVYKDQKDRDFVQNSGLIDERLVKALNYLISKHRYTRISHIISDYQYMNTAEAGTDTNPQIIPNISAHQDGLAADIDQLDFVYKVVQPNAECSGSGQADIVYYNDLNSELLRLKCQGNALTGLQSNTTWNSLPAEAIPIKILWQDCKPNIEHAGNEPDPCTTITGPIEQQVYESVYQPEAQRKVHQAIAELLKWPYDSGNTEYYRITQLITFSNERDVVPFQENGTLDKLYGLPRPANFGLFYMLESWQNIHIAY